jgi:hypothetical protein
MQDRLAIEAVDRTLRDLCNDPRPFGGITVVFGGDFQQILPVVPKGSREQIVNASIQRSMIWEYVELLILKRNMRLESEGQSEREFAAWLLDVGHGRNLDGEGCVELRPQMQVDGPQDLMDFVYPGISSNPPPPPDYFLNRMILAMQTSRRLMGTCFQKWLVKSRLTSALTRWSRRLELMVNRMESPHCQSSSFGPSTMLHFHLGSLLSRSDAL